VLPIYTSENHAIIAINAVNDSISWYGNQSALFLESLALLEEGFDGNGR
jgi:hypothetical protein